MDAALSLEPVLALLSVLARDLQEDCVPYAPRIIDSLMDLVEQGALFELWCCYAYACLTVQECKGPLWHGRLAAVRAV